MIADRREAFFAVFFRLLLLCALAIMVLGLGWRLWRWLRAPLPLPPALTPAPRSPLFRLGRLAGDVLFNPVLLAADPWAWLGAGVMHLSLLLVLLGHLSLFLEPAPGWAAGLGPVARLGGWSLAGSLVYLLGRRLVLARLLAVSGRSHYALLLLLLLVTFSGLALVHVYPAEWTWSGGGSWNWTLALHLVGAALLLAALPFSPLLHPLGLVLGPVRYAPDPDRGRPWPNPWEQDYAGDVPSRQAVRRGEPELYTAERYRGYLRRRWAAAGTRRVLGARERAGGGGGRE